MEIFKDGEQRYGSREWSPNIIRRLEDATGIQVLAPGFPEEMIDDEPEVPGYEIQVRNLFKLSGHLDLIHEVQRRNVSWFNLKHIHVVGGNSPS